RHAGPDHADRPDGPLASRGPRPARPHRCRGHVPRREHPPGLRRQETKSLMVALATSVFGQAGQALGGFLPRLLGALVLLIIGLLITRLIGHLVRRGLEAAGLDRLAERSGVTPVLARSGLGDSLAALIARAVRIG